MTSKFDGMNRRQMLAAGGAALVLGARPALAAEVTIRQGYQTNIWGMPTYYLVNSGALAKHGLKVQEFAVPSGNLTMQQMVGRQVDLGTYAGQSFVIGHDRGGLVAIAQIELVGRTARFAVELNTPAKEVYQARTAVISPSQPPTLVMLSFAP